MTRLYAIMLIIRRINQYWLIWRCTLHKIKRIVRFFILIKIIFNSISNMHTSAAMITIYFVACFKHCMIVMQYNFLFIIQIIYCQFILWIDVWNSIFSYESQSRYANNILFSCKTKLQNLLFEGKAMLKIVKWIDWMFCYVILW